MASISDTIFNKTNQNSLIEGQESSLSPVSSSSVEVASADHFEASTDSSPVNISPSPFPAVTALAREGTRLAIAPVLDELLRSLANGKVFPELSRSVSYGGAIQPKITNLSTRAASVIHEQESLIENEELEDSSQYLGSDSPPNLEFPSRQNSEENQPEQSRSCEQVCDRYIACAAKVTNSFYIVPFQLLLFGLHCFTFYVGIAFFHQCELFQILPIMVVLVGASGSVETFSRIINVLTKKRWFERSKVCRIASVVSSIYFNMSFAIESIYFSSSKDHPTTEKGPGHCHPFFYNYMTGYNCAVFVILIIRLFLYPINPCRVWKCIKNLAKPIFCH